MQPQRRIVQAIRSHEPIVYGKDWDYEPITISVVGSRCKMRSSTFTRLANEKPQSPFTIATNQRT